MAFSRIVPLVKAIITTITRSVIVILLLTYKLPNLFFCHLFIDTPRFFLGWPFLFKFLGRLWKIKKWHLERKWRFLQPIQPSRQCPSSSFTRGKINQYIIWIIHERIKHGKIFQKRKFFKFIIQFCIKFIYIWFRLWTIQKMVDAKRHLWWRFSQIPIKGRDNYLITTLYCALKRVK